ncbi:ABC transporter substrate-binding protein [Mycolicibacterium sp. jd]|uniref:ABC transporter substrate-binding protein n=1 Tax=unclassified Mycolicibacterium TaxID=2636767 RepID=UPI00351BA63D
MALQGRKRMIRALAVTTAISAVGATLVACSSGGGGDSAPAEGGTVKVDMLLPATLGIDWAAFLVASDKFWPEMGLDVNGIGTDGSSNVVQQIVAGNAEYGAASAQAVYGGALEGAPVTAIAMLTHGDVAMLSVPEDSDIAGAADLQGKAIGVTSATDGAIPIVGAVMKSVGVTDWEEPIVGPGGAAVVNAFQSNQIQAFAHGGGDMAAMEMGAGMKLRSIMPEDFANLPGNMLVVPDALLDDPAKTEIAVKLASGWLQAADWIMTNKDEAVEIVCKLAPEGCTDPETASYSVDLAAEGTVPLGDKWGFIDEKATDTLLNAVYGKMDVPFGEVFTNEYIDQIDSTK